MSKYNAVIVCLSDEAPSFWSGDKWTSNLSRAVKFEGLKDALPDLSRLYVRRDGVRLIKNYGCADQTEIKYSLL